MNDRAQRRAAQVDALVDELAKADFDLAHPGATLPEVAIVIAAYKERDNIASVITALPEVLCGRSAQALVVVDGDDDGTAALARAAGALVAVAPVNRGQGAALRLGYAIARERGATFIVTADADGQVLPSDLGVVLQPVVDGVADFSTGSRRLGKTEVHSAARNTGIFVFAHLISLFTRTKVTDTANPIRAFRADFAATLQLDEPQFQASELLISAIMSGVRYTECPVTMKTRVVGHSKKGGNFSYGRNYSRVVIRTWLRERRR